MDSNSPVFTLIAGVNGAGKTTFALDYFKDNYSKNNPTLFINADLIATGLSPNNPDIAQFTAGKLMLKNSKKCRDKKQNFAIETTLSSKNYLKIIQNLKHDNWRVELIYLYLPSVDLSIERVAERVKNGGHNIKLADIKRRYDRSIRHLINDYFEAVDVMICLDNENNSGLIFSKNDKVVIHNKKIYNDILKFKNAG